MESNPTSTLGTRLFGDIVCLWDETKIGALPPGMAGRLGMEMAVESSSTLVFVVGSAVLILLKLGLFFLKF